MQTFHSPHALKFYILFESTLLFCIHDELARILLIGTLYVIAEIKILI